jgi:hypothetical protein
MPVGAKIGTFDTLFVAFVGEAWGLTMATCPVCRKRVCPIRETCVSSIVIGALLA